MDKLLNSDYGVLILFIIAFFIVISILIVVAILKLPAIAKDIKEQKRVLKILTNLKVEEMKKAGFTMEEIQETIDSVKIES